MNIKEENIIKSNPVFLCSSCYMENCGGMCWWINRIIIKLKKNKHYGK